MKITYDSEVDALYIELRDVPACDGIDIEDGVSADFDEDGHVIGFEILDASKRLTEDELSKRNLRESGVGEERVHGAPRLGFIR